MVIKETWQDSFALGIAYFFIQTNKMVMIFIINFRYFLIH